VRAGQPHWEIADGVAQIVMMATSVEMVVEMRISLIASVFVVFIVLAFLHCVLELLAQIV